MVDATVNAPTFDAKSLQCAVHYLKTDGNFHYCVVPKGKRLDLPSSADESLSEWASSQPDWIEAPTGPVELPDGERGDAARLQVHVGQWPDSSGYEEDMQAFAQKVLQVQKGRSGPRRTKIQNREQLRTVAASASP